MKLRRRRMWLLAIVMLITVANVVFSPHFYQTPAKPETVSASAGKELAVGVLGRLAVKYHDGAEYRRAEFGEGWALVGLCDTRNIILNRDLRGAAVAPNCKVLSGVLNDPYTGRTLQFARGEQTSDDIQIDHVVALSNAWVSGASRWTPDQREAFANDPLELLAVEGQANQDKSGSDASQWLPPNKAFHCTYVARQIAIKAKYALSVSPNERDAMARVLHECPGEMLP